MKIGVKITLLIVIAVVGIAIISIFSLNGVRSINDMINFMSAKPVTNLRYANDMLDCINLIARNSAMLCVDGDDPTSNHERSKVITEQGELLWKKIDSLDNNAVAPEIKARLKDITVALEEQKVDRTAFTDAINSNNMEVAKKIRATTYQKHIAESIVSINELIAIASEQITYYADVASEEEVGNVTMLLVIIIAVVLVVLVAIAIVVIMGITRGIKKAVIAAEKVASGDLNVDLETTSKDEIGTLLHSFGDVVNAVLAISTDCEKLIGAAKDGLLETRADASKHSGAYKEIIQGINDMLDPITKVFNTTDKYVTAISDGIILEPIDVSQYRGDFNKLGKLLNNCGSTVSSIILTVKKLIEEAENGNLKYRADISAYKNGWKQIGEGVNNLVEVTDKVMSDAGNTLSIMATGDLTPRITAEYRGSFGKMKDDINGLGDSLTDLISQLQEAIHTTASASAQISSTADTLAAATQEQSSQTDEVASAMEEMSRTVTDNAHSATRTADVARQSGEVASSGGKVVEQTVNKMKEIAQVVKMSADNIAKLGESSKKIGEIIGVIDDIADQTNLLSLNAAIEAARAGEQGRGFAVVADSVGKLAVNTASATKEIADMIKGIQLDTEAAVKAMDKGTSEVQSGIELADNAGHSIQDILSGINELLDMVNQIAAASEEQSATSEQISKNVSSISKVTADSARNVEDVAATANELARMTETLTSLVSQFKINAGGLGHSLASSNGGHLLD